ncbi:hypothetical protein ACV3OC_12855 [Clostridium perfringens]
MDIILCNLKKYKLYWICEAIIAIGSIYFILKLNSYSKILIDIQNRYSNTILKAIEVAKEPLYFHYLLGATLVITILISYIMFVFMRIRWESIFIILINIILIIVFFIVYRNPILMTFAILLGISGVLGLVIS